MMKRPSIWRWPGSIAICCGVVFMIIAATLLVLTRVKPG